MALHTMEKDGSIGWRCPHTIDGVRCDKENTAHTSHEGVYHHREDSIALPRCECGAQTFLVVHPDMRNVAGDSIAVMSRTLELSRQLKEAGKGPGTQAVSAPPAPVEETPEPGVSADTTPAQAHLPQPESAQVSADTTEPLPPDAQPAPPVEVLSEDTAQRAAILRSRKMNVQVDPDGVMHWTCRQCGNDWVYSMRNSNVTWDGPDTIKLPVCACGNAPRLAASQYGDLASRLREIGKMPTS